MKEITFELTNRCLRNCLHCSTRANEGPENELSLDFIVSYLTMFSPEYANLSGGEPLLRKDIDDIIETVLSHGTKIRLYTTCLYEGKHINDIDEIVIPVFGYVDYINRSIMADSNYSALKLIEHYKEKGIVPTVHIVATALNIDSIKYTVNKLNNIGITKIKILKLVKQGRCTDNPFLVPDNIDLMQLHEDLKCNETVIFGLPFEHKCSAGKDNE